MTKFSLQNFLACNEGPSLDFKQKLWDINNQDFVKDIVSLANAPADPNDLKSNRAFIVVGVSDTKEIKPLPEQDLKGFSDERFMQQLKEYCEPVPKVVFEPRPEDGIIVVEIFKDRNHGPCLIIEDISKHKNKGPMPQGSLLYRNGSTNTRAMKPDEFSRVVSEFRGDMHSCDVISSPVHALNHLMSCLSQIPGISASSLPLTEQPYHFVLVARNRFARDSLMNGDHWSHLMDSLPFCLVLSIEDDESTQTPPDAICFDTGGNPRQATEANHPTTFIFPASLFSRRQTLPFNFKELLTKNEAFGNPQIQSPLVFICVNAYHEKTPKGAHAFFKNTARLINQSNDPYIISNSYAIAISDTSHFSFTGSFQSDFQPVICSVPDLFLLMPRSRIQGNTFQTPSGPADVTSVPENLRSKVHLVSQSTTGREANLSKLEEFLAGNLEPSIDLVAQASLPIRQEFQDLIFSLKQSLERGVVCTRSVLLVSAPFTGASTLSLQVIAKVREEYPCVILDHPATGSGDKHAEEEIKRYLCSLPSKLSCAVLVLVTHGALEWLKLLNETRGLVLFGSCPTGCSSSVNQNVTKLKLKIDVGKVMNHQLGQYINEGWEFGGQTMIDFHLKYLEHHEFPEGKSINEFVAYHFSQVNDSDLMFLSDLAVLTRYNREGVRISDIFLSNERVPLISVLPAETCTAFLKYEGKGCKIKNPEFADKIVSLGNFITRVQNSSISLEQLTNKLDESHEPRVHYVEYLWSLMQRLVKSKSPRAKRCLINHFYARKSFVPVVYEVFRTGEQYSDDLKNLLKETLEWEGASDDHCINMAKVLFNAGFQDSALGILTPKLAHDKAVIRVRHIAASILIGYHPSDESRSRRAAELLDSIINGKFCSPTLENIEYAKELRLKLNDSSSGAY